MCKKRKIIYMCLLVSCLNITACKKEPSAVSENQNLSGDFSENQETEQEKLEKEDNSQNQIAAVQFPDHYARDCGSIKADFDVEVPEKFLESTMRQMRVSAEELADFDVVYDEFIEGKEIKEYDVIEATKETSEDRIYMLENGEQIVSGGWFIYTSAKNQYYSIVSPWFVAEPGYHSDYEVNFATGEACVEKVRELLGSLGYPTDEYDFCFYPFSYKDMEQREAEHISKGFIKSDKKKEYWTDADDGYCIYAYQKYGELPIIHENMMSGYSFIKDTYDNAPVTAVISAEGIASLTINNLYAVESADEDMVFTDLDRVVDTVIQKYSYLLTDSEFVISRGKLCQMVQKNNQQEYETQPVWYFEITENNAKVSYMLVNAETAEEVSLGQ